MSLLLSRFADHTADAPDHVAVTEPSGRVISRAALLVGAHRIAALLHQLGVHHGSVVALLAPSPGPARHAADLAVLMRAAVLAAVPEQARRILQRLRPSCLIDTGREQDPVWTRAAARARVPLCVPHPSVLTSTRPGRTERFAALDAAHTAAPNPWACIAFSPRSHRALLITQDSLATGLSAWRAAWPAAAQEASSTLDHLPASYLLGRVMTHGLLMQYGVTVHTSTPHRVPAAIVARRPQLLLGGPATFAALHHAALHHTVRAAGVDGSAGLRDALRQVALAVNIVATLPATTVCALTELGLPLAGAYATTATTVAALHQAVEDGGGDLGEPIAGVTAHLEDHRLMIASPYIARQVSIWPDTTAVTLPNGHLSTGDRAVAAPDGRLQLLGATTTDSPAQAVRNAAA